MLCSCSPRSAPHYAKLGGLTGIAEPTRWKWWLTAYRTTGPFTARGISLSRIGQTTLDAAIQDVPRAMLFSMIDDESAPYERAFDDLRAVYLEDSWVLEVAADQAKIAFALEAVLTPDHPRYRPPVAGEHYCYRRGTLTITSNSPIDFVPSGQPCAPDASGEIDFGNIDTFQRVELSGALVWQLDGDWGTATVSQPLVVLALDD